MLFLKRADFVTDFASSHHAMMSQYPKFQEEFVAVEKPYVKASYHLGFSKRIDNANVVDKVNQVIRTLRRDGKFSTLFEKLK